MLIVGRINFKNPLILISLLFLPLFSHAQVVINEMQMSPTGERFLELYNTSDSEINLTGWYMQRKTATGSSFGSLVSNSNFENKTVGARGYFVVSRNSLNNSDIVLSTLTLTESNTIQIKNSSGDVVDKVGWGDVSDCSNPCPLNPPDGQSIQRIISGWTIAMPTPGSVNVSSPNNSSNTTSTTTDSTTTTTTTQTTSTNTTNTENQTLSAHYGSAGLSIVEPISKFEIGAGRARLGVVGSPIEFRPEMKYSYSGNMTFKWSFGDGAIGYGQVLSHSYAYPGDYVVVLNVSSPGGQAVSRVNVKIVSADISISTASPERVEIFNNSKNEINLFGRALFSQGRSFAFPEDTIIKPGQKISFASFVTGLRPLDENSVLMIVVGDSLNKSFVPTAQIAENRENNKQQIEILLSKAQEIQRQLAMMPVESNFAVSPRNDQNTASTLVALNLISSSSATTSQISHRGWLQTIKEFFLGKK